MILLTVSLYMLHLILVIGYIFCKVNIYVKLNKHK